MELKAIRRTIRATSVKNKAGRAAIRDGKLAAKAYHIAEKLRQYALELEAAAARERKKRLPREWWK